MMPITVRNITIGGGAPRIIVPIVAQTHEAVLAAANALPDCGADIAEWRIDHFDRGTDPAAIAETAAALRHILGEMPILCTFRTKKEGGAAAIAPEQYARLLMEICRSGCIDMIDVEIFTEGNRAREIIACARESGVCAVASNHDFYATPPQSELVRRLRVMCEAGADIAKIAVMPQRRRDVLTLMNAAVVASETLPRPVIAISMGDMGVISRIAGHEFGSACTFASAGHASAPGQIAAADLIEILRVGKNSR